MNAVSNRAAMHGPRFDASKTEFVIIERIARRAVTMAQGYGVRYGMSDAMMDLIACHLNGCPLRLETLEQSDNGTFGHDVFGIRRHIDRRTGALRDCFLPRTADTDAMKAGIA